MKDIKPITPMSRYKTGLDNFRYHVRSVADQVNLNKADAKSIPYIYQQDNKSSTKGVQSDFIMIFCDKNNKSLSFAFAFDYIGKTLESQTVEASIKYGDKENEIKYGIPMKMEEFKTTLNALNKTLNAEKILDFDKVLSHFSKSFMEQEFSLKETLKNASKDVKQFLREKTKEYKIDELENMVQQARSIREKAMDNIKKAITTSDAYLEREKLFARIEKLNKILDNKEVMLNNQENLAEKKKAERDAESLLRKQNNKFEKDIDEKLDSYPKSVKSRLKNNM